VIFRTRDKHRKMFSIENIFRENDFSEYIFQRKLFYVEVNGALIKVWLVVDVKTLALVFIIISIFYYLFI
jgi:hypothetical protein